MAGDGEGAEGPCASHEVPVKTSARAAAIRRLD